MINSIYTSIQGKNSMSPSILSESKLWSIMADYYNHVGPDAWRDEAVPSDISSNKYLANIYSDLIATINRVVHLLNCCGM